MPKRGRKNAQEAEAESAKRFVALRKAHSAVESAINALEHHGLNRCLDVGLDGYTRYIVSVVRGAGVRQLSPEGGEEERRRENGGKPRV